MNDLLTDLGNDWAGSHPTSPICGVGDRSKANDGSYQPDHDHDQNGRDVDIRYIRIDAATQPLNVGTNYSAFDKATTIALLNPFFGDLRVAVIIVSSNTGIIVTDVPGGKLVIDTSDEHDDHIHVNITDEDGPDANSC
jgi:hypothetical protein